MCVCGGMGYLITKPKTHAIASAPTQTVTPTASATITELPTETIVQTSTGTVERLSDRLPTVLHHTQTVTSTPGPTSTPIVITQMVTRIVNIGSQSTVIVRATQLVTTTPQATYTPYPTYTVAPGATQTPWFIVITADPGPTQTPWIIEVTSTPTPTETATATLTTAPEMVIEPSITPTP